MVRTLKNIKNKFLFTLFVFKIVIFHLVVFLFVSLNGYFCFIFLQQKESMFLLIAFCYTVFLFFAWFILEIGMRKHQKKKNNIKINKFGKKSFIYIFFVFCFYLLFFSSYFHQVYGLRLFQKLSVFFFLQIKCGENKKNEKKNKIKIKIDCKKKNNSFDWLIVLLFCFYYLWDFCVFRVFFISYQGEKNQATKKSFKHKRWQFVLFLVFFW